MDLGFLKLVSIKQKLGLIVKLFLIIIFKYKNINYLKIKYKHYLSSVGVVGYHVCFTRKRSPVQIWYGT